MALGANDFLTKPFSPKKLYARAAELVGLRGRRFERRRPPPAMSRWAVVLAGGVGSRFWPLCTPSRPKATAATRHLAAAARGHGGAASPSRVVGSHPDTHERGVGASCGRAAPRRPAIQHPRRAKAGGHGGGPDLGRPGDRAARRPGRGHDVGARRLGGRRPGWIPAVAHRRAPRPPSSTTRS